MARLRVRNVTRETELAGEVDVARWFWARMVGLLGRRGLRPGEGLLIEPCSSVHTMFMRFPIDVVTIDRAARVVRLAPDLKPFRLSGTLAGGRAVIELPAGAITRTGTAVGDQLVIEGR